MAGLVYTLAFVGSFLAWMPHEGDRDRPSSAQRLRLGVSVAATISCLIAAIAQYGGEIGSVVFLGSAMVGGLAAIGIGSRVTQSAAVGYAAWTLAVVLILLDGAR